MRSGDQGHDVYDVAVVGAGMSGLMAARDVARAGLSVVVLESEDRVGGRVLQAQGQGVEVELGARYFGDAHVMVNELVEVFGLTRQQAVKPGELLIEVGGQMCAFDLEPEGADGAEPEGAYASMVARLEAMASTLGGRAPWRAPDARAWDAVSVSQWLEAQPYAAEVAGDLRGLCHGFLCSEPEDVSLLSLLWYIDQSRGREHAVDHEAGLLEYTLEESLSAIAERMAAPLRERVLLSRRVVALRMLTDGVVVSTDHETVHARGVVLALPPRAISRIAIEGLGDAAPLREALGGFAPGEIASVYAVFARPFWRERGLSGMVAGDPEVRTATSLMDVTRPHQRHGVLACMLSPSRTDAFLSLEPDARRHLITRELTEYFGPGPLPDMVDYIEVAWMDRPGDPEVPGVGFGWRLPPGFFEAHGRALEALGQAHPRLIVAGTEHAPAFAGYVEGALRAGRQAARRSLDWETR